MFRYICIRVLYFIPTVIGISLVIFILSKNTPGDPIDKFIVENENFQNHEREQVYRMELSKKLGLDKPNFYLSFLPKDADEIKYPIIPKLKWNGLDNQYHNWFFGFLQGDLGYSYFDNLPVSKRIYSALKWTVLLNLIAIFMAYAISIPLGVYSAARQGSNFDKVSSFILFALYSVPVFWLATLLIMFLASENWLHWFPAGGLSSFTQGASYWQIILDTLWHLVLPVFCLGYIALAYISRQVRAGMLENLKKDYIRTAYVKGLSQKKVLWKHSFKNSLFPLITLFSNILPATIAGSVIVEVIFSIPGMGRLAYDGLFQQDWPLVFAIAMLGAILSLIGNLLSDVAYTLADPRVSF